MKSPKAEIHSIQNKKQHSLNDQLILFSLLTKILCLSIREFIPNTEQIYSNVFFHEVKNKQNFCHQPDVVPT